MSPRQEAPGGLFEIPADGTPAPRVSFEFFPPKSEAMKQRLWETIKRLEPLGPRFVSVTCGAGGSASGAEPTYETVCRIGSETSLIPTAHLTVAGATRDEIDAIASRYWRAGIRRVVALRGDLPEGSGRYQPHPQGYAYAADLVEGLKKIGDFEVNVAAYPETHPDAPSAEFDLDNLKRKLDAGATRAITQFFFGADVFLRFLERVRAAGIEAPIVPGIMPITKFETVAGFSAKCGTSVPDWLARLFDGLDDDPATHRLVAATAAAEQCLRLREAGVNEFHFYTMNRAGLTSAVCHMLGIRPDRSVAAGARTVAKAAPTPA